MKFRNHASWHNDGIAVFFLRLLEDPWLLPACYGQNLPKNLTIVHLFELVLTPALTPYCAQVLQIPPDLVMPCFFWRYPGNEDKARELFAKLDQIKTSEDFVAGASYLKNRADCTGKIGTVGFCNSSWTQAAGP